jgi:hypothetical protein
MDGVSAAVSVRVGVAVEIAGGVGDEVSVGANVAGAAVVLAEVGLAAWVGRSVAGGAGVLVRMKGEGSGGRVRIWAWARGGVVAVAPHNITASKLMLMMTQLFALGPTLPPL